MNPLLPFEVADKDGAVKAATAHPEEAACLVALLGNGATIHYRALRLWTEGKEDQQAGDSYDHVAEVCRNRMVGKQRPLPPGRWSVGLVTGSDAGGILYAPCYLAGVHQVESGFTPSYDYQVIQAEADRLNRKVDKARESWSGGGGGSIT
jgi:hypothetical protein